MDSDSEYDESFEITEDKINLLIKSSEKGSAGSIKKLLKLYHNAIKCKCSKKDENKSNFMIEEDLYLILISKSHDLALKLFSQTGPVTNEGNDSKIKITAKTFVFATILLLSNSKSHFDSIKSSLIILSKPQILRWIVSINHFGIQLLKNVFKLLSCYPNQQIRLFCFSLLKCYLDLIKLPEYNITQYGRALRNGLVEYNPKELSTKKINVFSSGLYKSYIISLSKGLNPKNWTLSRLSRNCVVELLIMIPCDLLYIIAFKKLRKIGKDTIEAWQKSKVDLISNWSFVESLIIWATVIARTRPNLDHLVYPLVTISSASLKLAHNNERFAPFILSISKLLNKLSLEIDKFIPIASHLLTLLDTLYKSNKLYRIKRSKNHFINNSSTEFQITELSKSDQEDEDSMNMDSPNTNEGIEIKNTNANIIKPRPELAIFKLSLPLNQQTDDNIMYHVEDLSRIILTQHISLLAHHPSFPEIVIPIVNHLKRYKSIPWIKKLLSLINESVDRIKSLRSEIKFDKVNLDKLIFFKTSKIPIVIHCFNELEQLEKGIADIVAG